MAKETFDRAARELDRQYTKAITEHTLPRSRTLVQSWLDSPGSSSSELQPVPEGRLSGLQLVGRIEEQGKKYASIKGPRDLSRTIADSRLGLHQAVTDLATALGIKDFNAFGVDRHWMDKLIERFESVAKGIRI